MGRDKSASLGEEGEELGGDGGINREEEEEDEETTGMRLPKRAAMDGVVIAEPAVKEEHCS